jgi:hypothetical protein
MTSLATLPRPSIGRTSVEQAVELLQQTADVLWQAQAEADAEFARRSQDAVQAAEARLAQARARAARREAEGSSPPSLGGGLTPSR